MNGFDIFRSQSQQTLTCPAHYRFAFPEALQQSQLWVRFASLMLIVGTLLLVVFPTAPLLAQDTGVLISDLDWSPDGQRVAAAIGRWEEADWAGGPQVDCESVYGLYFIDTTANEVTFMDVAGLLCSPTTIDFNPAGTEIAYTYFSGYGAIDLNARRVRQSTTANTFYHSIFWHPDGNSALVTANYGAGIVAYSMLNGAPGPSIGRFNIADAGFSFRFSVWSPDASRIATTTAVDGRIYIVSGNQLEQAFVQHTAPVRRLVWNAATNLIASGDDDGRVLVWNPDSGEVVRELTGHSGPILDIDWSADGTQIATASLDNTLRVWDWPSGDSVIVRSGVLTSAVAYSPDGTQLAYGGEITDPNDVAIDIIPIPVIDLPTDTPTPTSTFTPPPTPSPIPLPPANTNLLTNPSFASGLAPWNTVNFSAGGVVNGVLEVTQNEPPWFIQFAWSADGEYIAAINVANSQNQIVVFTADLEPITTLELTNPPDDTQQVDVLDLAWSPDGSRLGATVRALGSDMFGIFLLVWDTTDWTEQLRLVDGDLAIAMNPSVAWNPTGTLIATGSAIHNAGTGQTVLDIIAGSAIYWLKWHPTDSEVLFLGTTDSVIASNATTAEWFGRYPYYSSPRPDVSPDGQRVAAMSSTENVARIVNIIDTTTFEQITSIRTEGPVSEADGIDWLSSNLLSLTITIGPDESMLIYDITTGLIVGTIETSAFSVWNEQGTHFVTRRIAVQGNEIEMAVFDGATEGLIAQFSDQPIVRSLSITDQNDTVLTALGAGQGVVNTLSQSEAANATIQAFIYPDSVGSVAFDVDGVRTIDNTAPYTIPVPGLGQHTIDAIPYSLADAQGESGVPFSVVVNVIIDGATSTFTPTPTSTFTPTSTHTPHPTPSPIPLPPANTNLLTNPSFASELAPWNTVNFSAGGVVNGVLEVTQPTSVVWQNQHG